MIRGRRQDAPEHREPPADPRRRSRPAAGDPSFTAPSARTRHQPARHEILA